jgi:fructokinase
VILVCGEALIDLFAQATDTSTPTLQVMMGGFALNVAIGLVRLGTPTSVRSQ